METSLVFGIKTDNIKAVARAIAARTGATVVPHESFYVGDYYRLELPERLDVKPNYVETMGDWREDDRRDLGVIIITGWTKRPEYFEDIILGLGFKAEVLDRHLKTP